MPIVDRYRGVNVQKGPLAYRSTIPGTPLRIRGLGWLPEIQPAGMPAIDGGLAGLGDDASSPLDTILTATRDIVDTGLDIFQTVNIATQEPQTVVRTTTIRTPVANSFLAGGTGVALAALAAIYFLGGKRGRRR